ncbi:hypothetical protein KC867_03735, partial [Candidatus Saccharibacteria bacterium]|nr:hypothetical protein [Candidatus Saccharibacteria bacterium]
MLRRNTPQTPELELSMQYSIPYQWGDLHVTEAAHADYELSPLGLTSADTIAPARPNRERLTQDEDSRLIKRLLEPEISVILVGHDEINHDTMHSRIGGVASRGTVTEQGLNIVIGLTESRQDIQQWVEQGVTSYIRSKLELNEEDFIEARDLLNEQGLSMTEDIEQRVPQIIAGMVAETAGLETTATTKDWMRKQVNNRIARQTTMINGASLTSMAVIVAPRVVTEQPLSPALFMSAVALNGLYIFMNRKYSKDSLELSQ